MPAGAAGGNPPRREPPGSARRAAVCAAPRGRRDSDPDARAPRRTQCTESEPGPFGVPVGFAPLVTPVRPPLGVALDVDPPASAGRTTSETSSARFGRRSARKSRRRMVRVAPPRRDTLFRLVGTGGQLSRQHDRTIGRFGAIWSVAGSEGQAEGSPETASVAAQVGSPPGVRRQAVRGRRRAVSPPAVPFRAVRRSQGAG